MPASYQIQGLAQLNTRLRALPAQVQDKPVKSALRATGKVLKDAIVAAAPFDPVTQDNTHIRDNVQVGRSRRKSGPGREVFTVGIKYGKHVDATSGRTVQNEGVAWYWKLLEFGTSRISAQPFIRPAFHANETQMLAAFEKAMRRAIERLERQHGITP